MKKKIQIALALFALLPLGMQAQSVVTKVLYEGTQILNSDFETWTDDNGSTQKEPRYWHSFVSASGGLASQAKGTISSSGDNVGGKYACQLKSGDVFGIVNNGTMTTGRLNAGHVSATNPLNNASLDISRTNTDKYGDLFFSELTVRPTTISVWVKFTQGTANADHPYATISAAITNGEYYQEPTADEDSSMVIGYALNNTIRSNGGQWQHLEIPFRYDSKNFNQEGDDPQAIMVTFSTNADPGKGSSGDILLIDNLELVYTKDITIHNSGYETFTNVVMKNHKVVIPEGITAYTLQEGPDGQPMVKDTIVAGNVLPYEAAVLLEGKPGTYTFRTTLYEEAENMNEVTDFGLVPKRELEDPLEGYKYFYLTENAIGLGFYEANKGLKIEEIKSLLRVKSEIAEENYQHVLYKTEKKGDVDGSGKVDASDVKALVNRLLGNQQGLKGFLIPDADVNNDGHTTVADVTNLVNILVNE